MAKKLQCEGWVRHGGAFSFGPVKWEQCKKKPVVNLTIKRKGEKEETLPACKECWNKCIQGEDIEGLKIIKEYVFVQDTFKCFFFVALCLCMLNNWQGEFLPRFPRFS